MEINNFEEVYDTKEDLCEQENTIFSVAKAQYKSLVEYLSKKILPGRKSFEVKFQNTEFDIKQGLRDLDIILQYSILEIDYKRGKIRDESVQAIEGICENGILLKELRVKDPYFDWTNLCSDDNEAAGKVLKSLSVYISKVSNDFAKFFVFVDPSEEDINFRKEVQQKMNDIINVIDGQDMSLIGSHRRPECLANAIFKQLIK